MKIKRIAVVIMALVLTVSVLLMTGCSGKKQGGDAGQAEKTYTLQVVSQDGSVKEYTDATTEEYLKGAMDELTQEQDFTYEETSGMVITVDGERADYNEDGAYWAIYVNDEYGQYGIAEQPITDGDTYKFEYTPAA